ncbi:MAG: DUF3316 domain-containing protein [Tannerellaceae bacterium]|jgi:hypothetical protein|nr:DUF3316 domain-containing protein [Tannerellaceae bacterium]
MKRITGILLLCLSLVRLPAQPMAGELPRAMNEGTLIGTGSAHVKDTYLSPFTYAGWGIRILNERMKITGRSKDNFSRQQIINVDLSFTKNPAENVNDVGAFVAYSLGYHYRLEVSPAFRVLTGASTHLSGGFIYNTRNGNNPLSAKTDIDLGVSLIALWNFRINKRALTLRYQGELPFAGVFFSPEYGVSYYEMFNIGNLSDVVTFNSFHNKFALKNYVTVDIPIHSFTLRLGYLNSFYYTDSKNIETRIISNSFIIGWVKEFIPLESKRIKHKNKVRSAYY